MSEVIENDTKEKVALTEEQEQTLLLFIKTDNVYHKHYNDVLILLKRGLRISEQGYYIETPKTKSGTRQAP